MAKKPLPPPSDEDLAWAAGQLERFSHLRGYPDPEARGAAFQANCEALLRIVWRLQISEIMECDPSWGRLKSEDHAAWEKAAQKTHKDIPGDPVDSEWLISTALDLYDHFPVPIELREIYQEFLPPRDGKEWFRGK